MNASRLLVLIGLGVGLGIYLGVAKKNQDERETERRRDERSTPPSPPAAPPRDVEPTLRSRSADSSYLNDKDRRAAAEKESAAMQAVYARCSTYAVFREGSHLEGTHVPPMGKRKFELVNVSVELANPEKANGHTLWYEVAFDKGVPTTIKPQKEISATMCGLPPEETTRI